MDSSDKIVYSVVLLLLIGIVGLNFYAQDFVNDNVLTVQKTQGNLITGAAVGLQGAGIQHHIPGCPDYNTENRCEANNCTWEEEGSYSWCERFSCFAADNTNETYCENLNVTAGLNESCVWDNSSGEEFCDPVGGDFFGDGCSDFNGDESGCYSTFFCLWNATGSTCNEPEGGFGTDGAGGQNPSCSIVQDSTTCTNISGCNWGATGCTGHALDGISCSDLNKSICSDVTFLSTCCSWSGSSCNQTFVQDCYNNIPTLSDGSQFCEDTDSYKNETVCNQLAGSPWYMPCIFNKSGKEECHFNADSFGGGEFASFDEMGTELGCEAQGGIWKTEQYVSGGTTNTDSWCEFNFGSSGNCDSACYACENDVSSSSNTSAQAQTYCESSALGYCEYRADTYAFNGLGWCNPKQDFIDGGGKSCDDECSACDFLNSPENECAESFASCTWVNDSNAPNGVGNCYGQSEKYCGNDCFSCYTSSDCTTNGDGGDGACTWDNSSYFCKSSGFSGEVCFDGKDNDNDGKVDCLDSNCATDKFCGGGELGTVYGADCPGIYGGVGTNETCINAGCVWLIDSFDSNFGGEGGGHCDFPGAQCWISDDDETQCNATSGCSFINIGAGFCMENHTAADACFSNSNQSGCEDTFGCGWLNDTFSGYGRCESLQFSECFGNLSRRVSESACIQNATVNGTSTQLCGWTNDTYSPDGGYCDPLCFGLAVADCTQANTNGLCEVVNGICEPDSFGGGCFAADGNISQCNGVLNQSCTYFNDQNAGNAINGSLGNVSGWCDPKGDAGFIQFMGNVLPTTLATDANESLNDSVDIAEIYIRDDFDRFVFGTKTWDAFTESGVCNDVPLASGNLGTGTQNYTFFWYMDTNGDSSNGCTARDNSSAVGYEFSFKYQGSYSGSTLTETKVSYRCVDGNWGPVPIPLTSSAQKMCGLIGGAMAGIDKSEMFKLKGLFNKSADLRIYSTLNNITNNDSYVVDTAGPYYYNTGAFDFTFEDCNNPGGDADGDGITASNDPDCVSFLKFGYVPQEMGFQCGDSVDNDADGKTDCDDEGCAFDTFTCGGSLTCSGTDNSAPSVNWLNVDSFPDAAFVMYDTNEPSNGTLSFYDNDSNCQTLNKTIRDIGIVDGFLPEYKLWHDAPIDNFQFNPEAVGFSLNNGSDYYYKTTVCDVCGNCAVSACLNFSTKANADNCKSCTSTFNFPFTPPSGVEHTDPIGNLDFTIIQQDGTETSLVSNAGTGAQLNYSETKNFDLKVNNENASTSNWTITLINASINGKIAAGIANFSSDDGDIGYNSTDGGDFIGFGDTKCQELINTFRPKKLELRVPGNNTNLYQCSAGLTNCTKKNIGTNATRVGFNQTTNVTVWQVPAEWGC